MFFCRERAALRPTGTQVTIVSITQIDFLARFGAPVSLCRLVETRAKPPLAAANAGFCCCGLCKLSARRSVSRVLSPLARKMAIHLGRPLPDASRDPPGLRRGSAPYVDPIWSCSRWGLPCHPRRRGCGALLPHPFTLTCHHRGETGGLLSVALSLGLPPPAVNRHRTSVEPGLSSHGRVSPLPTRGHPTA